MAFLRDMIIRFALEAPDFFIILSIALRILHIFFASFLPWLPPMLPSISMVGFGERRGI